MCQLIKYPAFDKSASFVTNAGNATVSALYYRTLLECCAATDLAFWCDQKYKLRVVIDDMQ